MHDGEFQQRDRKYKKELNKMLEIKKKSDKKD